MCLRTSKWKWCIAEELKQQAAVQETGDSSPSQRQDSSSGTLPIIYSSECLATDDNWWLLFL